MEINQHISLEDALRSMDTGMPFTIGFITADAQKQKGGEYIFLAKCIKRKPITNPNKLPQTMAVKPSKNPNHYSNSTRNIINMVNGQIVKVHLRLIVHYNGKTLL